MGNNMSKYFILVKRMIEDYLSEKIDIENFIKDRFYKIWYDESLKLSDTEFKVFEEIFLLWDRYEPKPEIRGDDGVYIDEEQFREGIRVLLKNIDKYLTKTKNKNIK